MTDIILRNDPLILLVEDVWIIGAALECAVLDAGCKVLGPAATSEEAMLLLDGTRPAAALLDLRLGESNSLAVADRLLDDDIPFAFFSGVAPYGLPERLAHCRVLVKPASEVMIRSELEVLLGAPLPAPN